MKRMVLAITAALVFPQQASSHEIPVNTLAGLVQNCTLEDPEQTEIEHHAGICLGFIKGVSNALIAHKLLKVCPPPELENGDLIEAVISRARILSPKDQKEIPSAMFVQVALQTAFPC